HAQIQVSTNTPTGPDGLPILRFDAPDEWEAWLEEHGQESRGVWLQLAKKSAPFRTITYAEALDAALAHGWIDSQKRSYDGDSWLQRFTRRGPRSLWSRINRQHVDRLLAEGRMRPAGLREVEAARADGRWDAAYSSQAAATVPDDLQAALDASPAARATFESLNGVNRYAILFRIQTAPKPEI